MKIWVYLNGIQQGPYSFDDFKALGVDASTPVWYEGLQEWMPASEAPMTAALFGAGGMPNFSTPTAKCPPTYIGWSIFCLLCCCMPGGILGLIFSTQVTSSFRKGDYQRAAKMSEYAEWSVILSIVIGIIWLPFAVLMY